MKKVFCLFGKGLVYFAKGIWLLVHWWGALFLHSISFSFYTILVSYKILKLKKCCFGKSIFMIDLLSSMLFSLSYTCATMDLPAFPFSSSCAPGNSMLLLLMLSLIEKGYWRNFAILINQGPQLHWPIPSRWFWRSFCSPLMPVFPGFPVWSFQVPFGGGLISSLTCWYIGSHKCWSGRGRVKAERVLGPSVNSQTLHTSGVGLTRLEGWGVGMLWGCIPGRSQF